MLVNPSMAQVDVGLFARTQQLAREPADAILDVIPAEPKTDRASSFHTSPASAELEGYYTDPRLRAAQNSLQSEGVTRTLDAMKTLRDGAFRQIDAALREAIGQETGTTTEPGERLSVEQWQALPGDLRRSSSEVGLLGAQLAIANGNFTYEGGIDFPGRQEFADARNEARQSIESMATFRTLQIEAIAAQVRDGSVATLAERVGTSVDFTVSDIPALSADDLDAMRTTFVADGMAAYDQTFL